MKKRGVVNLVFVFVVVVLVAIVFFSVTGEVTLKQDVINCKDSDMDNKFPDGKNYDTRGLVTYEKNSEILSYQDRCKNETVAIEFYCNGDKVESEEGVCEFGCNTVKARCKSSLNE